MIIQIVLQAIIIKERGLELPSYFQKEFEELETRGWDKFATHLEAMVLAIVRKFYANAMERDRDYIFVKGKKVWFCITAINQFLTLNDLETFEYNHLMSEGFNMA